MVDLLKLLIKQIETAATLGTIIQEVRAENPPGLERGTAATEKLAPGVSTTDALKVLKDPNATPNEKQFALNKYKDAATLEGINPQQQVIELSAALREFEAKSPVKASIEADVAAEEEATGKFLPTAAELKTEQSKIAQSALQAEVRKTVSSGGSVKAGTRENLELFRQTGDLSEEETAEALRRRKQKLNKTPKTVT